MKKITFFIAVCLTASLTHAKTVNFGKGQLTTTFLAQNAVRIQYTEGEATSELPDWLYVSHDEVPATDIAIDINAARSTVAVKRVGA